MATVIEFVLLANWLLFLGILVYAIGWSLLAVARGQWQAANGQAVSRRQNPRWFWFGIALLLAIATALFSISTGLAYYRQVLVSWIS